MSGQVLVATLGTEPQVVTLALDLLRAKGYPISHLIVVHTTGPAVQAALRTLAQEVSSSGGCPWRSVGVAREGREVADIACEADVAALLRTLYTVILEEKRRGCLVHLSVAGGRKPMAVCAMVVAQLLFDQDDRVWHLLSPQWKPGSPQRMHVKGADDATLVPIPVLRWSAVSPVLTELALHEDPWEAIQAQRAMQQEEDRRLKRVFIEEWLTRAEQQVVRLACRGLDNATIARQLGKSEKTVANQLTTVYEKLHEWRGFRTDVPVSRSVLVAEFAGYFALERERPASLGPTSRRRGPGG